MEITLKAQVGLIEMGVKPIITIKPNEDTSNLITDDQWRAIHDAATVLQNAGFITHITKWVTVSPKVIELIKNSQ